MSEDTDKTDEVRERIENVEETTDSDDGAILTLDGDTEDDDGE